MPRQTKQRKQKFSAQMMLAVAFALVIGAAGGHYFLPASAASDVSAGYAYGCNPAHLPTLSEGATSGCVKLAQYWLQYHGYSLKPYGIDGDFGTVTLSDVRAFQKSRGITVNGVIGPVTWSRLIIT